jgi:hypothetical protein
MPAFVETPKALNRKMIPTFEMRYNDKKRYFEQSIGMQHL